MTIDIPTITASSLELPLIAAAVAEWFRSIILEKLGAETCAVIDAHISTGPAYAWATHESCDANVVMDEAFVGLGYCEEDSDDMCSDPVLAITYSGFRRTMATALKHAGTLPWSIQPIFAQAI